MAYNTNNGRLTNPTVSEVIQVLQDQLGFYGDTLFWMNVDGGEVREFQVDFYRNGLTLSVEERYEDEED